jgi:hypothetical protein
MSLRFEIYLALLLIGFIAGLFKFRYLSIQLKIITALLGITFISETISRVLVFKIRNSNPVYHFYAPLEILALGIFFFVSTSGTFFRKMIFISFLSLLLFSIINSIFFQKIMTFNSNVDLMKIPITLIISFAAIWDHLRKPISGNFYIDPYLIILIGILWFNITSFFFFIAHNYFVGNNIPTKTIGLIQYISNMVYYFIFLIAIVIFKKPVNERN